MQQVGSIQQLFGGHKSAERYSHKGREPYRIAPLEAEQPRNKPCDKAHYFAARRFLSAKARVPEETRARPATTAAITNASPVIGSFAGKEALTAVSACALSVVGTTRAALSAGAEEFSIS